MQIPEWVFPAPAGINRHRTGGAECWPSVPRASGDKPIRTPAALPLQRVFPAPAGINRQQQLFSSHRHSVPRISGDKPGALDAMMDIT
ncbi:TPA: hypothetical protein HI078_003926 [Escherichia coli]|nr:hypothetical protein [Escherichia coli]